MPHHRTRVVIADDHPVIRRGLLDILNEDRDIDIVGNTGEGGEVLPLLRSLKPDVLVLDLNMPGTNGFDVLGAVKDERIPVRVVVLTMHKDEASFNRVMDLGASGYVLKESAVREVVESIKAAARDGYYVSPLLSEFLLNRRARAADLSAANTGLASLSTAERKILKLVSENKTSKEIANLLFVSVKTVENHRLSISRKLDLHGSNSLLKFAIQHRSALSAD